MATGWTAMYILSVASLVAIVMSTYYMVQQWQIYLVTGDEDAAEYVFRMGAMLGLGALVDALLIKITSKPKNPGGGEEPGGGNNGGEDPGSGGGTGGNTPGSGGGVVTNTLTDAQKSRLNTLNNIIENNLKETDFSGTLRDLQGNPVPNPQGGYYDHVTEMKQSYTSLIKIRRGLEGSLSNPNLSNIDRKILQDGLDKANIYIQRIEKLFEPFGGIK